MPRRRTIGESPLDAVVPRPASGPQRPAEPGRAGEGTAAGERRVPRARITVQLDGELVDRMKNAVYWTPGLTLAGLAETALRREMEAREKERGEPFPPRREELRPGRPLR